MRRHSLGAKVPAPRLSAMIFAGVCAGLAVTAVADETALELARAVQPILANHCWSCHGPDEHSRDAVGTLVELCIGDQALSATVEVDHRHLVRKARHRPGKEIAKIGVAKSHLPLPWLAPGAAPGESPPR